MLETNSEKMFAGLIILVALLLAYLLMNMPQPTGEGYCTMDCDSGTGFVPYPEGSTWDLSDICESGCDCCEITSVSQSITQDGWNVGYKCCNCVGSESLDLPDCEGPFGFIYKFLGRCK